MASTPIPKKILARQHEITANYRRLITAHVADVAAGRATEMLEIRDFASQLCIHPTHLSNTIKLATGQPACYFFEAEILAVAQGLLRDTTRSITDIAASLTYDPSNFTKFFKRFTGLTPRQYREQEWAARRVENSELLTS
ncbi:AraC family transcriptional regulator [Hymenobacter sp. BRD128]|uniref:helix-turn-helix domain-containing protein n=1 Tax=Hymenobacter sp. BRD128 TaxID=2675878 RepID=UPI0015672998|nr:helix-turn-helix domain-containing protein [Hymenobacter sp. BRD128]QKG56798.1 AraC family transcriptional regulator [Hymenobacter sp. BRD128]